MSNDLLVFNGIDGDTGTYDLPPMAAADLLSIIRGEATPENIRELRYRVQQANTGHLGVKEGVDPKNLAEAGWGVIFPNYPAGETAKLREVAAIREALQPLLNLRQKDTRGGFDAWVSGEGKGYRVGVDTKNGYLARHGAGPGPADPKKVPYYLLIVGSPADIPYRFQSQLDVQYAVGRLHFATLQEYADYAASVVAIETGGARLRREAALFGVANQDDKNTRLSAEQLVTPLTGWMQAEHPDWSVRMIAPQQATKATLSSLLGGPQTPSLLFTASHGMKFDKGSPRQLPHQGALLCQDWPGPQAWRQPIPQDFYFAGDDLAAGADLLGLIAFFFACYGGGTPELNEFALQDNPGVTAPSREAIAPHPFLAALPTAMLGRPRGALAVVGHVERAWSYSFNWGKAGAQTAVFESTLKRLLEGHPLGSALEFFNERYAELSTVLSDELEDLKFGKQAEPDELAGLWTANNDARGYAIIGDPAVRLPVARGAEPTVARSALTFSATPGTATAPAGAQVDPPALTTPADPAPDPAAAPAGPIVTHRLRLARIADAMGVIDPVFLNTPQYRAESLEPLLGCRLVVKVETLNPIRSFKGRGASYYVAGIPPGATIVCASAGNFGQAMAYAGRARGVRVIVYASVSASPLKLERMRALGAEVRLHGEDFDAAKLEAKRVAAEQGLPMVEDSLAPETGEGAGTIGLELLRYPEPIDAMLVALGNGALLTGVGRWVKAHAPQTEVVGVAAAGAPAMVESWRTGAIVTHERIATIADGIGVRIPVPEAVADMRGTVDDAALVSEQSILDAMRLLHEHLGLVVEPSGAVGLAAILEQPARFRDRLVATVLCGGNLTPQQMREWLGARS